MTLDELAAQFDQVESEEYGPDDVTLHLKGGAWVRLERLGDAWVVAGKSEPGI